jgi:glycosyltransferase involved in cell wall biosynthesis
MKCSLLLLSYNQERYIVAAIRSAISQDYPNIELVVCDDGSSDRTVSHIEEELSLCPAHISLVKAYSPKNQGLINNINYGISLCTGDFIVLMAGDDISLPNRVGAIANEFSSNTSCMLICSNWSIINEEGHALGVHSKHDKKSVFSYKNSSISRGIYAGSPVCGAASAFRRNLVDFFGPMKPGLYSEDNCYWVRAMLLGDIHFIPEVLVQWRKHGTNIHNSIKTSNKAEAKNKYFKFLKSHKYCSSQWKSDINAAWERNTISCSIKSRLLKTIQLDIERTRLRRFSLSASPWRLWLGSSRRMLVLDPSIKTLRRIFISALFMRVCSLRRSAYWKNFLKV